MAMRLLKQKCTEYSAYDISMPLEDIIGNSTPVSDFTIIILVVNNPEGVELVKYFSPTPTYPTLQLTNPLTYTIKGHHNIIKDRNLNQELRTITFYGLVSGQIFTQVFSYIVESAFILPEDFDLNSCLEVNDMECTIETTTTGATTA